MELKVIRNDRKQRDKTTWNSPKYQGDSPIDIPCRVWGGAVNGHSGDGRCFTDSPQIQFSLSTSLVIKTSAGSAHGGSRDHGGTSQLQDRKSFFLLLLNQKSWALFFFFHSDPPRLHVSI